MPILADAGLVFAFRESTASGKGVLFLLLLASLFSWSIMITKFLTVRRVRQADARFLKQFRSSRKPMDVFLSGKTFPESPAWFVYQAGCREMAYHLVGASEVDDSLSARMTSATKAPASTMNSVRSSVERETGEQGLWLESQMSVLATVVSGGPFLGLLGTVWGVMDTFSGIAASGSASLTAMAPGVAGALITTTFALCVAIPAMFGYNYLVVTIRGLTIQLDNFAAEMTAALEHRYIEHR